MASTTRIYEVQANVFKEGGKLPEQKIYLVDATSRPAAEKHVAMKFISGVSIAKPKRIAELMATNIRVEKANEED